MIELGTAKRIITPHIPVFLSGYADREEPCTTVLEDIKLRVLSFKDNSSQITIVNADLLWWSEDIIRILCDKLSKMNINPDNIIFTATHNHSGPGLGSTFLECLERANETYREEVVRIATDAIIEAQNDYEEIVFSTSEGNLELNVYRRLLEDGQIKMKPNYKVEADKHLTLIRADRINGKTKGIILHYPCHANLSKENVIQPDWPGSALNMIDEEITGCTSIFLQGCTGDLRPNSVLGNKFIPCDRDRVLQFATIFKDKAIDLYTKANPSTNTIKQIFKTEAMLPLDTESTKKEPTSEIEQLWKKKIEEKYRRPYEVLKILSMGVSEYSLLFFNAEVVQSYAAYARSINEKALCSGYTNGMIGYLANEKQIEEGGYESKDSAIYFALAGTFNKSIEEIIKNKIKGALI